MLRDLIKPGSEDRFNGGPHGTKAGLRSLALVRLVSPTKVAKSSGKE